MDDFKEKIAFNEGEKATVVALLADVDRYKREQQKNDLIAKDLEWYKKQVFKEDAEIKAGLLKKLMELGGITQEKIPDDLVELPTFTYQKDGLEKHVWSQHLRQGAFDDFLKMNEACGGKLVIQSGYRSPTYQSVVFMKNLTKNGWDFSKTETEVAFPGQSQHGSTDVAAVDLMTNEGKGDTQTTEFAQTPEFTWLTEHAAEHNFTMPYFEGNPEGKIYEPWHWMWAPKPR